MSEQQSSIVSQYGVADVIPIDVAVARLHAYQRIVSATHAGDTYQISPVLALSPGQLAALFTQKQLKNLVHPLGDSLYQHHSS